MNIERNISLKVAALYILSGIIVLLISIYIYRLRNEIQSQRAELELQQSNFTVTNDLIKLVNAAQLAGSQLIATGNSQYSIELDKHKKQIDSLILVLKSASYPGIQEVNEINRLLTEQLGTLQSLSTLLDSENPLLIIQKRISEYKPPLRENISVISVKEDTIIKPTVKKKFFRRLREVFAPDEDSTIVVTNQRIDTLRIRQQESLSILSEVDTISRKAGREYTQNIRQIEQQLGELLMADRTIASRISVLLIQLHDQTLQSVMKAIAKSEVSANRNYLVSVAGGVIALLLMLVFILLIINDVNKGKLARTQLRQVLDSRHQLLLSVSHDIKSPLSSLQAYLELQSQKGEDTRSMQHAITHTLSLLENLLEYSSLEQGNLQVSKSTVELSQLGKEITELFEPLAHKKQLHLSSVTDPIYISVDVLKLRQIIINLISNAIKYTPQGEVSLQLTYQDATLQIEVRDTGAGIPNDKLDEIFLPFTRIESNNALAHGSGFGMYVVKGLTELMGGHVHVESKVGKGTLVRIELPADAKNIEPAKNQSKKILVIEDDPLMHDLACSILRQLGHEVVESGYEMVLTDLEMGEINGKDILQREQSVPVVLMTGSSVINREIAQQMGFAEFLSKPFSLRDLETIFGKATLEEEDSFFTDDEEIRDLFCQSTLENQQKLKEALKDNDFSKAQAICHKMLPMMAQLGYTVEALSRMDASRGNRYKGWQQDVAKILEIKV